MATKDDDSVSHRYESIGRCAELPKSCISGVVLHKMVYILLCLKESNVQCKQNVKYIINKCCQFKELPMLIMSPIRSGSFHLFVIGEWNEDLLYGYRLGSTPPFIDPSDPVVTYGNMCLPFIIYLISLKERKERSGRCITFVAKQLLWWMFINGEEINKKSSLTKVQGKLNSMDHFFLFFYPQFNYYSWSRDFKAF